MKGILRQKRLLVLIVPILLLSLLHPQRTLLADPGIPEDAEQQQLLQKGLSIVEIDHEIERIAV